MTLYLEEGNGTYLWLKQIRCAGKTGQVLVKRPLTIEGKKRSWANLSCHLQKYPANEKQDSGSVQERRKITHGVGKKKPHGGTTRSDASRGPGGKRQRLKKLVGFE